jgi:hypothetical protein
VLSGTAVISSRSCITGASTRILRFARTIGLRIAAPATASAHTANDNVYAAL